MTYPCAVGSLEPRKVSYKTISHIILGNMILNRSLKLYRNRSIFSFRFIAYLYKINSIDEQPPIQMTRAPSAVN